MTTHHNYKHYNSANVPYDTFYNYNDSNNCSIILKSDKIELQADASLMMVRMSTLPAETLVMILERLDAVSLTISLFVSRRWNVLATLVLKRKRNALESNTDAECSPDSDFFSAEVARRGWVRVLRWARSQGCPWGTRTCEAAARSGNLALLQWARAHGCPWNSHQIALTAAEAGHLDVLQWVLGEGGAEWSAWICAYAAKGGNLEVLKWARANGCPWATWTCAYAAEGGHLEVLKWARENGCPWSAQTCARAAGRGHLTVLRWARDNGCPWDIFTCTLAAAGGHEHVLDWARENGCPNEKDVSSWIESMS